MIFGASSDRTLRRQATVGVSVERLASGAIMPYDGAISFPASRKGSFVRGIHITLKLPRRSRRTNNKPSLAGISISDATNGLRVEMLARLINNRESGCISKISTSATVKIPIVIALISKGVKTCANAEHTYKCTDSPGRKTSSTKVDPLQQPHSTPHEEGRPRSGAVPTTINAA